MKVSHLVEMYRDAVPPGGRTKGACLARLEARLKRASPDRLHLALRDYIDKRQAEGAGGTTIAQDLSDVAGVLEWARHTRRIDVDPEIARDARRSLKHRRLDTRSRERERIPTQAELVGHAGKPHAALDVAGAGNVPTGNAPVLDPTDEEDVETE